MTEVIDYIYSNMRPKALYYCRYNAADADDLIQDTVLMVVRKYEMYNGVDFSEWKNIS